MAYWQNSSHLLALLLLLPRNKVDSFILPSSEPMTDAESSAGSIRIRRAAPSLFVVLEDTTTEATITTRRRWIQRQVASTGVLSLQMWWAVPPFSSDAATVSSAPQGGSSSTWTAVRADIALVITTLQKLVTNWERAVIDCTYADVPRELLEQKNKELLLEKASTFALFDKSVSVTSCKTVNNRVRDYLGRTGIGPVAGLDGLLKQTTALVLSSDRMDVEEIDSILQTIEEIQRELTRADSFSYSARRDFSSMNNFDPEQTETVLSDTRSNLALCKAAIETAVDKLNALLNMLPT